MAAHGRWLRPLSALLLVLLAACPAQDASDSGGVAAEQPGKLRVLCTTGMITDIARNVAGEHAEVTGLMGPGVDPHLYKARESDVDALFNAQLIFYNGLHLEAKLAELLERMGEGGRWTTVAVAGGIPPERLLRAAGAQGAPDPHVWFDVGLWRYAVEAVRDALCKADAERRADYERNAEEYLARLDELDAYVKEQAGRVPSEQRVLITAHDAFGYFGRAYGFEVLGLQGISTAAEAGTADVQQLVEVVVERRIPAIFVESSVPERSIKAVQEAARARGWQVEIGTELYSDALGDAGTAEGTYLGMVRHNIDAIVGGLLGE